MQALPDMQTCIAYCIPTASVLLSPLNQEETSLDFPPDWYNKLKQYFRITKTRTKQA